MNIEKLKLSDMENKQIIYSGISFTNLLFIVLLVLKVMGYLTWSWWWVTAPIWMPFAGALALFSFVGIIGFLWFLITWFIDGRRGF